jgi:tRNA threonylcarbamoyladenosine biosynthesis protein TsaB
VIVLGFDTATPSTAVALRLEDGSAMQARDDPSPTQPGDDSSLTRPRARPAHATRLLGMADELLGRAGIHWRAVGRIAVGVGPGTFTGLRVGIATARGLAQSLGVELVGVSSLRALAEPALRCEPAGSGGVFAVLDARRGEAFLAAYGLTERGSSEELVAPRALGPEEMGGIVEQTEGRRGEGQGCRWLAIGDGAVRFRDELQDAGVAVAPDDSSLHLLSAEAICALGARGVPGAAREAILPDYCRPPDAEIALERAKS